MEPLTDSDKPENPTSAIHFVVVQFSPETHNRPISKVARGANPIMTAKPPLLARAPPIPRQTKGTIWPKIAIDTSRISKPAFG